MRRKKDNGKIQKSNSFSFRNEEVVSRPLNISSFMFLSMITLMLFTVATFLMYTFPYLLEDDQVQYKVPKKVITAEDVKLGTEKKVQDEKHTQISSIAKKPYTLDPKVVLEERNAAMKKYSYPFSIDGVDKRSWLPLQEFYDVYDGKWPVIITDVVPKWPAFNWTKKYFVENYGQSKVAMQAVDKHIKETLALPLELYLSHLDDSTETSWTYLQDELFLIQRPELRKQVLDSIYTEDNYFTLFPQEVQPWDCMFLWGTANSRSTLHVDPYNWTGTNAVISGKKLWKLVPPGQDHLLAINHLASCGFPLDCIKYNSPLDAHRPKDETEQEQVNKIRFVEVEQNPGEMLFIPTGWFHQAFNPVPTLAISGQLMTSNNYRVVLEEIFKGGGMSRTSLPPHADDMGPKDLVSFIASNVPAKIREKGAAVTKSALDQMANGKSKHG